MPPQYPPQYPPGFAPHPPPRRRSVLPWVVGGVVVVAAVVVIVLVTVGGRDAGGDRGATEGGFAGTREAQPGTPADLDTPEDAAISLYNAAASGDGDALLELTCVGHPDCVRQLDPEATAAQTEAAKNTIRDSIDELTDQLSRATLFPSNKGSDPHTREVRFLTPDMADAEYGALTFIEFDGDWLYVDVRVDSTEGQ